MKLGAWARIVPSDINKFNPIPRVEKRSLVSIRVLEDKRLGSPAVPACYIGLQ